METDPGGTFDTDTKCQIFALQDLALPSGIRTRLLQIFSRIKRIGKRRYTYFRNVLSVIVRHTNENETVNENTNTDASVALRPGDIVRIRSRNEIQATLNNWNQLKGCSFMEEMWPYCGTQHKVLKPVRNFLDERDYSTKKCRGIVVLEGLICEGTRDFGVCDRSCHFFWREEWLQKLEVHHNPRPETPGFN